VAVGAGARGLAVLLALDIGLGLVAFVCTLRALKRQQRLKYSLLALWVLVTVLGHLSAAIVLGGVDGALVLVPSAVWTVTGPFFLHLCSRERDMDFLHALIGAALGFLFGVVLTWFLALLSAFLYIYVR
jgi:hypothetical protein